MREIVASGIQCCACFKVSSLMIRLFEWPGAKKREEAHIPTQLGMGYRFWVLNSSGDKKKAPPTTGTANPADAATVISRTGLLPLWGLPCTSEFFCWPLRRRMRSQYTPIYYRKSPVPSIELSTNRCSLYLQLRLLPSFVPPLIAASHILLSNSPRSPFDFPHGS